MGRGFFLSNETCIRTWKSCSIVCNRWNQFGLSLPSFTGFLCTSTGFQSVGTKFGRATIKGPFKGLFKGPSVFFFKPALSVCTCDR